MTQLETLQKFLNDGWSRIDLFGKTDRPKADQRVIMTDGRGDLIEIDFDGEWYPLKMANIDDDQPIPMFTDTANGGVFGYMSDITFSYELGGTCVTIWPTPEGVNCHKSCGLVKVEVIGVQTLAPMDLDVDNDDDTLIHPNQDDQIEMDDGA